MTTEQKDFSRTVLPVPDQAYFGLTTYDAKDPYTGNYYKSKLLMEDTGVTLTYRDFGGKWNLICTDRILELRDLHRDMFKS